MTFCCSRVDGSAAENVGRVLARRCLQCGITNMTVKPESTQSASEKVYSSCTLALKTSETFQTKLFTIDFLLTMS